MSWWDRYWELMLSHTNRLSYTRCWRCFLSLSHFRCLWLLGTENVVRFVLVLREPSMFGCSKITKIIDGVTVLDSVDCLVNVWEIHCIVWPSWSGKSMLLSILSWLTQPTSWTIYRCGQSLHYKLAHGSPSITDTQRSSFYQYPDITLVSQTSHLWPHMTMKHNILLPLQQSKRYDGRMFDELVNQLWIRHILEYYPSDCSGGEKQRACLVRQLLLQPTYLLLDEVTSALDVEYIQCVCRLLLSYRMRIGMIVVTHQLAVAKQLADTVTFLDRGEVVEQGRGEILNNPQSERMKEFVRW